MANPTLVLIPGLLCDATEWTQATADLEQSVTVYVAEHGLRSSLVTMAQAIIKQVPGPLLLAGHSMGGRIALEAFRLAPQRVRGMALLDTGCRPLPAGPAGEQERAGRLKMLELARKEGMRAMAREWLKGMVYLPRLKDAVLTDTVVEMFARRSPDYLAAQVQALLRRPDASMLLAQIHCPTLVLCGQQDRTASPAQHRAMHGEIAGSRFVTVSQCGHMSPLEKPAVVRGALKTWVDSALAA
jgi:pimeloyl-ACP methyl ester carboxylesterase